VLSSSGQNSEKSRQPPNSDIADAFMSIKNSQNIWRFVFHENNLRHIMYEEAA
jgi:hypothetical protein